MAFHWNCYQGNNATSSIDEDKNTSKNGVHYDADGPNNSFILKRIMVCVLFGIFSKFSFENDVSATFVSLFFGFVCLE